MFGEYQQFVNIVGLSVISAGLLTLISLLTVWSLAWKGIALWKAARNGSKRWFVVLFLVNTVGLLEIIYIFFFSKKKNTSQQ